MPGSTRSRFVAVKLAAAEQGVFQEVTEAMKTAQRPNVPVSEVLRAGIRALHTEIVLNRYEVAEAAQ